jgi:hypothetical protein
MRTDSNEGSVDLLATTGFLLHRQATRSVVVDVPLVPTHVRTTRIVIPAKAPIHDWGQCVQRFWTPAFAVVTNSSAVP